MSGWRKICCPVDFSVPSRVALEEAADLAHRSGAELFVVHVKQHSGASAGTLLAPPPPRHAAAGAPAGEQLDSWTREALQRAPGLVTSVELSGDAATEIARFVSEFGCDLIVVGTHGRTGLRHLVLGSVAEGVIRAARCPVLVVRGAGTG